MHSLTVIGILVFAVTGTLVIDQHIVDPTPLTVPSSVKGTFERQDVGMPKDIDKGAKGGPVDEFVFTISQPVRFRAMLECESCLPRLILNTDARILAKTNHYLTADIDQRLQPGKHTLWAGTITGRDGSYLLQVSDDGKALTPKLKSFPSVAASYQSGTKTIKALTTVRLGWESVVAQKSAANVGQVFKAIKYSDILGVDNTITSTANVGAIVAFGAYGAAARSEQRWITIRTADEAVVLNVPARHYAMLLAELQRVTGKQ
jgi:hypothetical protein